MNLHHLNLFCMMAVWMSAICYWFTSFSNIFRIFMLLFLILQAIICIGLITQKSRKKKK